MTRQPIPHPAEGPAATIADRLAAAAVAHRDAQEVARLNAKKWRQLIVEAIESGMHQQQVAALAGVSRARIHGVIVTEYSKR